MNSDAAFLKNVRTALKIPQGAERNRNIHPELFVKHDNSALRKKVRNRSYEDKQLLIKELAENCTGLGITLHLVDSVQEAEDLTVELVRTKTPEFSHNRHVIQHNHPDIAAMQLWKRFNRESVTVHTTYVGDVDIPEKTIASYIGITAPDISVADSATLMQLTSSGCPRSTSLVPSIHIALTRSENLVANLQEAYALLEEYNPKDSFVFISGPSKTADIEAHLVHGAHGPKELHLILIKEAEPTVEILTQEQEEDEASSPEPHAENEDDSSDTTPTNPDDDEKEPDMNDSK